ncbi:MAG TPA: TonB-dependent receptor [Chryseolinea sp.]
MKKFLSLVVLMGLAGAVMAQSNDEKGNGRILGTVMDAETNQPVEYANVALLDPATEKPIDGAVCDDQGKFVVSKVAPGNYIVAISFIGYETQNIKGITVEDKRDEVNLGIVKLASSTKVLNEVVVEGQKQLIEERVDRTIYNAENDITSKGGDATDVLKRVPMLSVDLDGNVSLRGSQNITVLVNNKPSTIMASSIADALKQIPADEIKTVEVITSPSAKYDAEGTGGIINIVTKKNSLQGATLNVNAGVGNRGSNLGLNGNYRTKKMGFSLGGWGRANYNVTGSFENSQATSAEGTQNLNLQKADTRSNGLFGNYTLGWDYDIDKKNTLTASVRFGARNNESYQDALFTQYFQNDVSTRSTLQDVTTKDLSNTVDVNLTYTHLYEKPQKEFSILALYSKNNRNNDFQNNLLEQFNSPSSSSFINFNDSYNQEIAVQADFQTPIGTNQLLEVGGKDIMRRAFSDYARFEQDADGQYNPVTTPQYDNNLNYDQNVLAGYLAYTLSLDKGYSIKAGSRYEYTVIEAYSRVESNIEIPSYGVFVPSVNLSKKLKAGNMIKLAYNRRIQRPSIQFLNPNRQNSNEIDITEGNPTLDPEYTNNYELSYNTYIKGSSLNFTSFVRNTTGSIQRVRTPQEGGAILTTYQNIGTENAYGLSIFANVNMGKLSLNGGTDLYYAVLDDNISSHNEGWVVSGRIFGNYNLDKGWGLQFFSFYRGRDVQLQGTRGGFGIYSLGVRKEFNDKRGSIGLGAENFFTPAFNIRSESSSENFKQKSLNVLHNMGFRINFSYRIGKMSVEGQRPRRTKSINNDDLKDGGGDNSGGGMDGGGAAGGPQQRGGGGFGGQGNNAGARGAAGAAMVKVPASDSTAVVDASGSWAYTIESPQGGEGTLLLKKEGDAYTGSITNKRFNSTTELSSVSLKGNELNFAYEAAGQGGNKMPIQVKAVVTGDTFSGSMTVGQFGTFPVKAKRE